MHGQGRGLRRNLGRTAAAGGAALVAIGGAFSSMAAAKSSSVKLRSAQTNLGNVLIAPNGFTLYRLKPETTHHLLCKSSQCLAIWPPLLVHSRSTHVRLPAGTQGKVTFVKRGHSFQVALRGLPLYKYAGDTGPRQTHGQNIHSFGGIWSVVPPGAKQAAAPAQQAPPMSPVQQGAPY